MRDLLPRPLGRLRLTVVEGGRDLRLLVHAEESTQLIALIAEHSPGITAAGAGPADDLQAILEDLDPQICLSYRFQAQCPRDSLLAHNIRYLHVAGTGFDHISPWDPTGLTVCTSAGFQSEIMADYVLGALLVISLRLPALASQQERALWMPLTLRPVSGPHAVVFGTEADGREIARRLRVAGLSVTGVSRKGAPNPTFEAVYPVSALSDLLQTADHLVVVVPRTLDAIGLLSREILGKLPSHATLVNVARGAIVDEDALVDMLRTDRIGGAVIDVFETEPLRRRSPLWTTPGLVVTPNSFALFDG